MEFDKLLDLYSLEKEASRGHNSWKIFWKLIGTIYGEVLRKIRGVISGDIVGGISSQKLLHESFNALLQLKKKYTE